MKKSLLIAALFGASRLFGQSLTNGGFESWNSTPYDQPTNWYSSNPQSIIALNIVNVTKVTGFSGQAVHMQTYISAGDTDFGYVSNTPEDPTKGQGGIPYTQQSTGISGYYKYNLPVKDTAFLFVIFKKNGSIIGQYFYKIRGTGSQPTFTTFNYTFTPALAMAPDTVVIAAASSNVIDNIGIQNGSWLELDELAFTGPSATIPNGTFDTWNSLSEDMPVGWSISTGGPSGTGVSKTATHYAGSFAISLLSQPSGGGGGGSVNAAIISNGRETPNNGPKGGQPYTNTNKDTLIGYYQYTTPGNDSGVVSVGLTKNGSGVGGNGMQLKKAAVWTQFKVGFQAFSSPDTILVAFASSVWSANSTVGSVLLLDNVYLQSQPLVVITPTVAVEQNTAYPNPAKNVLNIQVRDKIPGTVYVHVYDITGRAVIENVFTTSENVLHVNIAELQPGIYFYKLDTPSGNTLNKFIKE